MATNALSKLLSYSHATLPYSVCVMYKKWRKAQGKEKMEFEDFSSNRFGRTSTLAKRFLQHRDDLIQFFEQCVEYEHANKLSIKSSSNYHKMHLVYLFQFWQCLINFSLTGCLSAARSTVVWESCSLNISAPYCALVGGRTPLV